MMVSEMMSETFAKLTTEDLTYEKFKDCLPEVIENYLPAEYWDANIYVEQQLEKVGCIIDKLVIRPKESNIGIAVSLNALWADSKKFSNSNIFEETAKMVIQGLENIPKQDFLFKKAVTGKINRKTILNTVVFRLGSQNNSAEFLQKTVHRKFLNLFLFYRLDSENCNIAVTQNMISGLGITEAELYAHAKINTEKKLPGTIINMADILPVPNKFPVYILTNKETKYGSSVILDELFMEMVGRKLGCNYYVLPSSIHEVIVVPADVEADMLFQMVREINETAVAPEEFLSDSVYLYDREKRQLSIACEK